MDNYTPEEKDPSIERAPEKSKPSESVTIEIIEPEEIVNPPKDNAAQIDRIPEKSSTDRSEEQE